MVWWNLLSPFPDPQHRTLDQAFLAHVVLPSGETVGEYMARPENLRAAIEGRTIRPLLEGPR